MLVFFFSVTTLLWVNDLETRPLFLEIMAFVRLEYLRKSHSNTFYVGAPALMKKLREGNSKWSGS